MSSLLIIDSYRTRHRGGETMSDEVINQALSNNKALYDYWYGQVELRNIKKISSDVHVTTPDLRHNCTNYDQLRQRPHVLALDEAQRNRVQTIIKYECTAQVLQRRAGILKDRANALEAKFRCPIFRLIPISFEKSLPCS